MSKVLVIAKVGYADEFDCEAFKVYDSREEWQEYLATVEIEITNSNGNLETYFGSNESLYYNHVNDLIRSCEVVDITDEQAEFLRSNFRWFGTGHSAIFEIGS